MTAPVPKPDAGILVRKYGGSSLATVERLKAVAGDLRRARDQGHRLVVVVSAMGDSTDDLVTLAQQVSREPPRRELDMLLSVGERITASLLAMALAAEGCPALSLTGSQCGIITDTSHSDARILEVRGDRVREALARGQTVVVAGFQGVSLGQGDHHAGPRRLGHDRRRAGRRARRRALRDPQGRRRRDDRRPRPRAGRAPARRA